MAEKKDIPVAIDNQRPPRHGHAFYDRPSKRAGIYNSGKFQERDYTADEVEFMNAMHAYKTENRRPFPSWSEVLEVLLALGYRKLESRA